MLTGSTLRTLLAVSASLMISGLSLWDFPAFSEIRLSSTHPAGMMTAFLRCAREEEILKAFRLLEKSQGEASLQRILNKPIRVLFKDMRSIHKTLKNYDALSWISNHGEQVIFINEKHRTAPPEALAALIAHEAMHDDEFNSLSEEVVSWRYEALVWAEMKARNPELSKPASGKIPLVERENRIESEMLKGTLEAFVRSSPGYQGLPETSPGFPTVTANQWN